MYIYSDISGLDREAIPHDRTLSFILLDGSWIYVIFMSIRLSAFCIFLMIAFVMDADKSGAIGEVWRLV